MDKRLLILGGVLLVVLALVCFALGCVLLAVLGISYSSGQSTGATPSASPTATDLRVLGQREVDLKGGQSLVLSPDGKWLAAIKDGQSLCVYASDSLAEKRCVRLPSGRGLYPYIAWSLDSAHVAFTEHYQIYFESDLWVLEIETGRLTNLTNNSLGSSKTVDVLPSWSFDGGMLAFYRRSEEALYYIPVDGGTPKKILDLPGLLGGRLFWTRDGENILFPFGSSIWMVGRDGRDPQQLLGSDLRPPVLMDVSTKGNKALIYYREAKIREQTKPNVSYYALMDLETGIVEPLKQAKGNTVEFYGPFNATFSPDGSKVLYVCQDTTKKTQLAARDVNGETEYILLTCEEAIGILVGAGPSLQWATNNTVYATISAHSGLLLSLGSK